MWHSTHSGQDFAVPSGTKVIAAHGGTVVKAGGNGAGDGPAYGNDIVIKHANGMYSQYAHLSRIEVQVGQVVNTGQKIAPVRQHRQLHRPAPALRDPHDPELRLGRSTRSPSCAPRA